MKNKRFNPCLLGSLVFLLAGPTFFDSLQAQVPQKSMTPVQGTNVEISPSAEASLTILGDSTLHSWTVHATQFNIRAASKDIWEDGKLSRRSSTKNPATLEVSVSATGLKSTEGSSMDKIMCSALESEKFPKIFFSLKKYDLEGDTVTASGVLSIHGITKNIVILGDLSTAAGILQVQGKYDLLMSDYGVKPPVLMFGAIRAADKVTILFRYDLIPPR